MVQIGAYKSALKELDIKVNESFNLDQPLPWDIIEMEPRKTLLINELKRLEKRQ